MNIISWVLFGLIGGLISYGFENTQSKENLREALTLGVLGAFSGGMIASLLLNFNDLQFSLISFLIAVAGAVFVLTSIKIVKI